MRIPDPYFVNVPEYGNLHVDEILLEDIYPILFTLKNDSGKLFLCLCCEIRDEQRWVANPITTNNLIKLLTNKLEIRQAFTKEENKKIMAVRNYTTEQDSFKLVKANELDMDDLPSEGELLDAEPDEFKDYILKLKKKEFYNEFSEHFNTITTTCRMLRLDYSIENMVPLSSAFSYAEIEDAKESQSFVYSGRMMQCV